MMSYFFKHIFPLAMSAAVFSGVNAAAALPPTELHDRVYFGDEDSEREHGAKAENAPVVDGELDQSARKVEGGGALTVTMKVDPQQGNMLTVRLWGGDVPNQRAGGTVLPGRFVYRTKTIPEEETRDRNEIDITLDSERYPVYAAYTHSENVFVPPEDEVQGEVPENGAETLAVPAPEGQKPDFDAIRQNLIEQVDRQVENRIGSNYSGRHTPNIGLVYMTAHRQEGSRYYGDERMIHETVRLLDQYCRHQKNETGRLGDLYMAVAMRNLARSFLELWPELANNEQLRRRLMEEKIYNTRDGETNKNITRRDAYTLLFRNYMWKVYPRIALRAQCANQDEHNVTAAWYANEALKILSPEDAYPEGLTRAAQRHLWGKKPWDPKFVNFIEDILRDLSWSVDRRGHDQYLISPGGISMEWGFSQNYGQHFLRRPPFRDVYIDERVETYISAMQHFFIPWRGQDGNFEWVVEGVVGTRGTQILFERGFDSGGRVNWLTGMLYAAYNLEHPAAERIIRLGLPHADNLEGFLRPAKTLRHLPVLERVWRRGPSEYRLPAERSAPYAWIDSTSAVYAGMDPVMIKGENHILYLQYRGYHLITDRFHSWGGNFSGTHFHYDDQRDKNPDYLAHGQFGPYLIVVNQSDTANYHETGRPLEFDPPEELDSAVDLLSGDKVDLSRPIELQPREAYIFDTRRTIDLSGTWRFHRGNNEAWKAPDFNDSDWEKVELPAVDPDYKKDGYGWYRITGVIPESWKGRPIVLSVGRIADKDVTYVNGYKVGSSQNWKVKRRYAIPEDNIRYGGKNVIAIQVQNRRGLAGVYEGPLELVINMSRGEN